MTHLAYAFSSNAGQNGETVCAWIKTNFPLTTGNLSSIKTSVHSPHHQIRNLKMNLSLSWLWKTRMNFNTWRCPHNQTFHQKIDLRVQRGIGGLRPFVDILDRRQTIGLLKWALKKMSFKRKLTAFFMAVCRKLPNFPELISKWSATKSGSSTSSWN